MDKKINKAILDTIWLWQKSECRYYKATQYAFMNKKNNREIENFAQNEYLEYLIGYKVKRTIKGKGAEPLRPLLKEIFKEGGFAEKVMKFNDNPEVIDDYIEELKENKDISDGKRLISLVSKTAFLLRPDILPLYDGNTKKNLEAETNQKIKDFKTYYEAYTWFKNKHINKVQEQLKPFESIFVLFDEMQEFDNMSEFIAHRVIDKMLWL